MPNPILDRIRAQMAQGAQPPQVGAPPQASLAEQFSGPALQRVQDLGGGVQDVGGALGAYAVSDYITSLITGEDVEAVRQAREAHQAGEAATIEEKLDVPEAETGTEKAAQFLGSATPDIALGVASSPLFVAGKAAAAGAGARPLAATFAGEATQSAALAPVEFASRPPEEAAAVTALAPVAGTLIGRGLAGAGRLLPRKAAAEAVQAPAQKAAAVATADMQGNALARIRETLKRGTPGPLTDPELDEAALRQVGRENFAEALRNSTEALNMKGISPSEAAVIRADVERQLGKMDPTTLGIVRDSIKSLPPEGAAKFVKQLSAGLPPGETPSQWIQKIRASFMLSGFGTHTRNLLGNLLNVSFKPARTLGAAAADLPMAAVTRQRTRYFSEGLAETYGMFRSLPAALKQEGHRARAVREIIERSGAGGTATRIIEAPLKLLNVADRMWYDRVFAGEMYRQAARQAASEGKVGGSLIKRTGEILAEQDRTAQQIATWRAQVSRAEDLMAAAPESVGKKSRAAMKQSIANLKKKIADGQQKSFINDAAMMADRTIFTAREGEWVDVHLDKLDEMAATNPLINLILPFRRTPANIARETLRGSPLGAATGAFRAGKAAVQGTSAPPQIQGRLADDMGQALVGTATMYYILSEAAAGNIRINPFKERKRAERVTEEAAGVVPDSLLIGNWSIPVSRLEPIGSMLLAAARVAEMRDPEADPTTWEQLKGELEKFATILATQGVNESFLDPLGNFSEALTGDDRTLNRWAQSLGGSFVPRAISQFDTTIKRPVSEEDTGESPGFVGNFIAGFKRQILGTGEADIGLFGQDREVQARGLSMLLGRTGQLDNDPLAAEMLRVGALHLPPTGLSTDFKTQLERRGIGYTDAEDRTLRKAKGHLQRRMVERIVNSPGYAKLGQQGQRGMQLQKELIDRVYRRASDEVNQRAKALKLAKVPLTPRMLMGK